MYFDRGLLRRKMDNFFTFFQMYVKTKNQQPMDIDFMLSDTFEVRQVYASLLFSCL